MIEERNLADMKRNDALGTIFGVQRCLGGLLRLRPAELFRPVHRPLQWHWLNVSFVNQIPINGQINDLFRNDSTLPRDELEFKIVQKQFFGSRLKEGNAILR